MDSGEKITRHYKARLTKAEQKEFRALLWEFRRTPPELAVEERERLEQLFAHLPRLRELYDSRNRFKELFDSHCSRRTAKSRLRDLLLEASEAFPRWSGSWRRTWALCTNVAAGRRASIR